MVLANLPFKGLHLTCRKRENRAESTACLGFYSQVVLRLIHNRAFGVVRAPLDRSFSAPYMYLSSLTANGFKSFADLTHLKFEPGVTAVVGPNGCGKSNIADAIRWVLGEQSAKALRGGKMQDVIFEGTDRRKPVNICEVSIILTDCEKELGQDFNEVELARRVHRDGGSNYFLNGNACRLKDIQRLFMDTGVGRTSYSIMAQGQIDQILSSKPEERRSVFEEAAGISKYKAHRKEALNKLGHVETNLDRVTDVIAEISRQIGSLKRQATKAIRYKKLSHKLRHLDVGYSAYQHGTLSNSLGHIDKSAGSLQGEVDALQVELEKKEARLIVHKEDRQSLIQKIQDSQQAVFDLRSMQEQTTNQTQLAQIRINSMGERIEQACEEIGSYEGQIGEFAARLDEHSQDKQMHLDVLGNSDEIFQERNRELAEIEDQLAASEVEIQELKFQAQQAENTLHQSREQMSLLEVEAGTSSNRLMRLEEELAEQSDGQAEAQQAFETFSTGVNGTLQRQAELEAALEKAREDVSEKRDAFRATQVRIQELDRTVTQKTARIKLLQQLQEKLEGYGEGAKALLKGRMQGDLSGREFSPLASNLLVKDGYGSAMEALLGSAVEAVSVGDADTVIEVFRQLEDREVGRVCVKLNNVGGSSNESNDLPDWLKPALEFIELGEDDDALKSVLSASYVVEDVAQFLKWWEGQADFKFLQVASRKGESVDSRGLATGGYKKGKNSSILQREIELRQTSKELEADQKTLQAARDEAEKINKQLEASEDAVERHRREIGETRQELSRLQAEARNAQKMVQDQKLKAERLERERESLEETRSRATEKLDAVRSTSAGAQERLESAREQLESVESGISSIRASRDEKREGLSQAKFDLQEKKQKLDMLEQGLVEIEQRRSELTRLTESKTNDIEQWETQIVEQQEGIENAKVRSESVDAELKEAKALVEKTRESLASIEGKVELLEREQAAAREKVESLRSNLNNQNVQIAEKRSRLGFVQEEIEREYGIDLSSVDWKFEMWKARQPVEDLPKLDLDTETLDSDSDESEEDASGESEEAVADTPAEGPEESTEEVAVESADKSPEDESEEQELTPEHAAPKGPSEEELEELEATNWSKIKAEIQALRKRVQSMGAVNTDAIEEYGELRERHLFLKTQYDDLTSSRDKLVAAIDEINIKSREQFSATFDQIRANFKQTFDTLFSGGKADLQLIETDDVLESGIDIVAQPPGTRLKNISLLSGGQRTMTAVGLLFAIYMVKPSPFCLLDELDAPLDESNIGRFTTLLKQFTKQSQFIIITHNKRTIQAAQAIYGVTMEEKGVSKVVSMKFNSEHEGQDIVSLHLEKPAALA